MDRVTALNISGWLCNKMSVCLLGEIPCGLKGSRLNRLLLPQKGGDCYTIAEQAIELYLFMFYILLLSTDQTTGWFVNNPPDSSRGQGSTVVTNDKNKNK